MAIEYVDHEVITMSAEHLGMKWPAQKGTAHLILILAGLAYYSYRKEQETGPAEEK
jgi:hypothetical protein